MKQIQSISIFDSKCDQQIQIWRKWILAGYITSLIISVLLRGGDLGGIVGIIPSKYLVEGMEVLLSTQYLEQVIANCHKRGKEKMRHPWPWPTYKQHRPIIWRLQQLHVAVRHSNCLLSKWTYPHPAACGWRWWSIYYFYYPHVLLVYQ